MIRVDDVVPPVIELAVCLALDMWHVAEPPEMMQAYIAIAPVALIHDAWLSRQIRKIVPVVAIAQDFAIVAPVIITDAVGREMHIAAFRFFGVRFVVANEALPEISLTLNTLIDLVKH